MTILLASLIDAAIVLACGLIAAALVRRRSAALRHAILVTSVIAAGAMPFLELVVPQRPIIPWHAPVIVISSGTTLSSDVVPAAEALGTAEASDAAAFWTRVFVLTWAFGAGVMAAGLITGLIRLARLRSRCLAVTGRWRELTDELSAACGVRRAVRLLQSDAPSLLVTCGLRTPTIILPASASHWTEARMRVVLLHELAHITRHDAVIQLMGETLRALQWINPLVWIACRRLRQESEYACDDVVLTRGVEATEYATHLLDVARHLSGRPIALASAVAIAHPSTLERRIAAMLNRNRSRAALGRRGWVVAALVAVSASLPLAATGVAPADQHTVVLPGATDVSLPAEPANPAPVRPLAASERRPSSVTRPQAGVTLAGALSDQHGGLLPGVRVTLTNAQTGQQHSTVTSANGRYAFRDLPSGQYELVAQMTMFATVTKSLELGAGSTVEYSITLPLGSLSEQLNVVCSSPSLVGRVVDSVVTSIRDGLFPVVSAQDAQTPLRIGGSIKPPMKIRDVKPICPAGVPAGETTVQIVGRLMRDGFVSDLAIAPDVVTDPPADLVEAVFNAVREWRFTPAKLNNVPVDVNIGVKVVFRDR